MSRKLLLAVALAALTVSAGAPALADQPNWHGGWHDNDIHHFNDHDYARWRGGHWYHGWYGGHFGWWWQVGPVWYPYPAPVYPYPDPYVPPTAAPGAAAWYYCPPARAYYPYVPSCPVPWQIVPAR